MLKKIIPVIIIMTTNTALADNYTKFNSDGRDYKHFNDSGKDNDKYRDWNKILSQLNAEGIETDKIDWDKVDANCAAVKSYPATSAYNKCRYANVTTYGLKYEKDKKYCAANAQQEYFEYLKSNNNETVINNYPGRDKYKDRDDVRNKRDPKLSKQDERKFRESSMVLCMSNLGWQ